MMLEHVDDFWRFTKHGIRYLLQGKYEIRSLDPVDYHGPKFPASSWAKARKCQAI